MTTPPLPLPLSSTTTPQLQTTAKRPKRRHDTAEHHHHHESLIPGLPDDIAQLCLSLVPASNLYSVCRSWRRLIYSPSFPPFLSLYALILPSGSQNQNPQSNSVEFGFNSFDPISSKWQPLPPPPTDPPLRFLFRHRSFISRKIPIQTVAVAGKLVVLAATDDQFLPALSRPLVFDAVSRNWDLGPPLSTPRRWCAAGALRGAVYVASGIGARFNTDVARSVEKWELNSQGRNHQRLRRRRASSWQRMGNLRDGKFSREAIDAVGWRGKLCMVNVKGDAAKEGIIYDVERDCWEEMPEGMLAGWRGPAAAMYEDTVFVVDESKGLLKKYDHVTDTWVEVLENCKFKGAQQAAAAGGRVCVLSGDGSSITVVDVAAPPPARLWVVDVPVGFQVLALHILPRSNHSDFYSE